MWIFEPACEGLVWMHVSGAESRLVPLGSLHEIPDLSTSSEPLAYVLHHGGPLFTRPVTPLDEHSLKDLGEVEAYLPVLNHVTLDLASQGYALFPQREQVILCETAYFSQMPADAAAYGLPYEMFGEGMRRYGGHGLQHAWAWRVFRKSMDVRRVVSIALGDAPSLCAILDGRPLETSAGFTLCDGIPSLHSSGTLDPGIPILLQQAGFSPSEIEHLLTCTSGWQTLTKTRSASLLNILESEPGGLVWQMLRAQLLKELGKCMAAVGGTQALLFTGEEVLRWYPFVQEICENLRFCGIETGEAPPAGEGVWRLEMQPSSCLVQMRELRRSDVLEGWVRARYEFE